MCKYITTYIKKAANNTQTFENINLKQHAS